MSMARTRPCRRIDELVSQHAGTAPQSEALVLGDVRWSYLELHTRIDALARALLAAGVTKGDRVATLQTPHPEFIVCFLAAASIGAIWAGLNPKHRLDELAHVVTDAEPCILITRIRIGDRSYLEDIAGLRKLCPALRQVVAFPHEEPAPQITPMREFLAAGSRVDARTLEEVRSGCGGREPCLIVYTSGSTGRPKGALLHHEGICTFSAAQNSLWPVCPLRLLNYFPINHIGCTIDVSLPCLAAGGTLLFMESFDTEASLTLMAREKATVWASVPGVFTLQLASPAFRAADLSSLQLILWEGAAMPARTIHALREIHPRLATNYGMTETTSAITALAPTDDEDVLANSVGTAFPDTEIRLVDPAGRDVPDGREGEVLARSARNMLGYWRNPRATRDAFTEDGFFRTGDLAIRRPDGRYRLVGRLREMFKSGGYNVYPREIEMALEAHPAVALAAIVPAPDPVWQEVGVAFVQSRTAVNAEELKQWCAARLANYKIPKRFVIRETLPLLAIGKVDKGALKALSADLPATDASTAPRR